RIRQVVVDHRPMGCYNAETANRGVPAAVAHVYRSGGFEGPGELLTAAYLERELPDTWHVVCNKEVPGGVSSREVDFIIVGDHAIFVVEEKHWSGRITGDEEAWILS